MKGPARCGLLAAICWLAAALPIAPAADLASANEERQLRERYERILALNPFQERAFDQVFESYLKREGVDRWIEALTSKPGVTNSTVALLLLGQIHERQFNATGAIASLETAARQGEARPEFKALLGSIYYKNGQDERAAGLLQASLDGVTDLDRRSTLCRMLGSLYLRQGKRDDALKVWRRIADQNGDEIFARQELAEICEDNRLWDEAIAVHREIAAAAKDDPYRRCRALRSIGQCLMELEKHRDAIAVYEEAVALVAPGNWLFEDLKTRLVGVYEDTGDLNGLVRYLQARLEQSPDDLELHELLAEAHTRLGRLDWAEQEHRLVLARNPRAAAVQEKLLALFARQNRTNDVIAILEQLGRIFPSDLDYVRRLGEAHLGYGDPTRARATWEGIVKQRPTGERFAELAGWYESSKLPDEAMRAYEQALERTRKKDWVFRLATLKLENGAAAEALQLWLSVLNATSTASDYVEVAAILEANHQIEEAARLRRQAADLEPGNLEHRLACARDLMELQQFTAALGEYSRLAAQNTNEFFRFQGESGRLDAYAALGVLDEKRQEWELEVERNPRSIENLARLARVYDRMGQRDKAVQLLERRQDLDPENIESLRALASAYKSARQTRHAVDSFRKLLEADKTRARVYHKELLEIHLAAEAKADAISAAENIVTLAPSDPEARIDLGQVYWLFEEKEKGLEQYRHAVRLAPNEPEYHRHLGEALSAAQRWEEATASFRKVLDVAAQDQTRLGAVQSLARIHAQQGTMDELLTEFSRRVRNTPKKLSAYEELAVIHRENSEGTRAIEVLENGLQAVEEKGPALRSLIRLAHEAHNLPKLRQYFEQLIAVSGKPSIFEYERLAELYAQCGQADKAKLTWSKILELAPRDVKVMKRLAGTMRDEGFGEEALNLKARTVALAPFDHKLRFEYAQMLASIDRPGPALEQLQKLLELGEQPPERTAESNGKTVRPLARGRRAGSNPFLQAQSAGRGFGQRLTTLVNRAIPTVPNTNATSAATSGALGTTPLVYSSPGLSFSGASWKGSFAEFKPQLIAFMAHLARNADAEEAFVASFRNPVTKNPANLDARRELLMVLLALDRQEESLRLAGEILAEAPNDFDVLQVTAQRYTAQGQNAKAVPLLEKLVAADSPYRSQAGNNLIPLYFGDGQPERALALARQLLAEQPAEYSTLYTLGGVFLRQGQTNFAKSIYERGLTLDPRYRKVFQRALAGIHRQTGDPEAAVGIYREMLLAETATSNTGASVGRTVSLYHPQLFPPSGTLAARTAPRRLPATVLGAIDSTTNSPLAQLIVLRESGKSSFDAIAELEQAARTFHPDLSAAERNRAGEAARILFAHYLSQDQYDRTASLVKFLHGAGKDDIEWYNIALYLDHVRGNFSGMLGHYDELAGRQPSKAREILIAKTKTFNLARQYQASADAIRALIQQRLAPREFLPLIQPLATGDRTLAKPLLEEYLANGSRDSDVLALFARTCATEQDFERAIELASEAFDRRPPTPNASQSLPGQRVVSSSGVVVTSSSQAPATDPLVRELYSYYSAVGRTVELIDKFRQRLEGYPTSIQLHDNLAQLLSLNGQRDQALEVYQALAKKFPHLLQPRMSIARVLTENRDFDKAVALYENLLKTHPEAASQINSLLRSIRPRVVR